MVPKLFRFIASHSNLTEVLMDHRLASLGDMYVNFVYSLAVSNMRGRPSGVKVKGTVLAEALKKAGLRERLPSRMTRHRLADAAEAVIVYAWLNGYVSSDESVAILEKTSDSIDAFSHLLAMIRDRIRFF
jgi:hypothetical protein